MTRAYMEGFCKMAESVGINPDFLIKTAAGKGFLKTISDIYKSTTPYFKTYWGNLRGTPVKQLTGKLRYAKGQVTRARNAGKPIRKLNKNVRDLQHDLDNARSSVKNTRIATGTGAGALGSGYLLRGGGGNGGGDAATDNGSTLDPRFDALSNILQQPPKDYLSQFRSRDLPFNFRPYTHDYDRNPYNPYNQYWA